jgi:glycosyltransferase involved in cell wall biosynthesis
MTRTPAHTTPRGLRIAMIGQRGLPATYGGVERHVEELGTRLVELGHDVLVYCRPNYSTDPQAEHRGVALRHLNTIDTKHFDAIVHSGAATLSAMRERVDVVHYHALGPGLVAPVPRVFSRAKVVQTVHGLDQERSKWGRVASSVLGFGCWMSARVPDATVVVSKALQRHYQETYRAATTYISNGVDEPDSSIGSDLLEPLGLRPGSYVLFVGRLVPEKAPDMLLRAFKRLEGDDLRLVVAGGSSFTAEYVASLEQLAREDPRVVMPGYVHGEQLAQLYANAGLFVLPSEVEGMPLTLLEAASYGTPILASDIPPHREMLGEPSAGRRMFRRGDDGDLLAQMRAVFADPQGERDGAEASKRWVHKEFSWDRAAEDLSALYLRLVRGAAPEPTGVVDLSESSLTTVRLDRTLHLEDGPLVRPTGERRSRAV